MRVNIGVSVVWVQGFVYHNATDSSVCVHNVTGLRGCCSDYKNVSGKCEKCIGSFGKECTIGCSNGYYGHGCRLKCNCAEQFQICDSKYGCIASGATFNDSKTTSNSVTHSDDYVSKSSLLAFCGSMVLLLSVVIIYLVYQKLRKRNIQNRRPSASVDEQQDTQKYGIYNDVRESRKHAPSRNFDLPTYFFDNTEPTRLDIANNACTIPCQVRLPSTRPEIYDDCNRLNSPSSSPIYSRVKKT